MSHSSLILNNVSKSFDDTLAVDQVALRVDPEQLLVLLGPSGCGKTTVLRLLAGLEEPDKGEIWLDGQRVAGNGVFTAPEDRQVGLVFQDYALFPHLSVIQNVHFGLRGMNSPAKAEHARAMLELVGLAGLEKRMPHELSGGQQQRVALARALAPQPHVILLDEPFSNLDTALRSQVRSEVRSILREAGITSVFVTHDQEEALSLGDQIAVMFNGRIQQIGRPQAVYWQPATRDVASFVGEANYLPAQANGKRASCVLGELLLVEPQRGKVELMLRPENLILHSEAVGIPAEIQWIEFYGHDQRIGLRLDDATPLIARAEARHVFTRGQSVHISVDGAVLAYPD